MDEKTLKHYMSEPTSGEYLLKCMNGRCNIISYSDLENYDNIDDIFINGCCFILVETKQNTGHWIVVFKLDNKNIEVFTSYGGFPDMELYYVPKNLRKTLGEDYPHLTALLLNSKYYIHYNDYPLQSKSQNIATCGRHCIIRVKNKKYDIDTYAKILMGSGQNPDKIVTELTLRMINGK